MGIGPRLVEPEGVESAATGGGAVPGLHRRRSSCWEHGDSAATNALVADASATQPFFRLFTYETCWRADLRRRRRVPDAQPLLTCGISQLLDDAATGCIPGGPARRGWWTPDSHTPRPGTDGTGFCFRSLQTRSDFYTAIRAGLGKPGGIPKSWQELPAAGMAFDSRLAGVPPWPTTPMLQDVRGVKESNPVQTAEIEEHSPGAQSTIRSLPGQPLRATNPPSQNPLAQLLPPWAWLSNDDRVRIAWP